MRQFSAVIQGFFLFSIVAFMLIGLGQLLFPGFWIASFPALPFSAFSLRLLGLGNCLAALGMLLVTLRPDRHAGVLLLTCLMLLGGSLLLLFHASAFSVANIVLCGLLFLWGIVLGAAMLKIKPSFSSRVVAAGSQADAAEPLAKTLSRFRTQRGHNLLKLSNEQSVLVLFLEEKAFSGSCVLSKMVTYAEKQLFSKLDRRSIVTVFVHHYSEAVATAEFEKQGMADAQRISDPNGLVYAAFQVDARREPDSLRNRLSKIIPASSSETSNGLAAAFLINKGQLLKSSQQADNELLFPPDKSRRQPA